MLECLSEKAVVQRCSNKIHRKTSVPESLFNKAVSLRPATLLKKRLWQGVSCEFCKISKNTFSYGTPPVAASAFNAVKSVRPIKLATLLKRDPRTGVSELALRRSSTK